MVAVFSIVEVLAIEFKMLKLLLFEIYDVRYNSFVIHVQLPP